ncbi:hypothetical protein G6F43_000188 [Rhizopus delemar]|nr:hypothetical protein G6F43_000188 [Rhizopus delemar]
MPTVVNLAILVHPDFKLPVHHIHHEHPLLAKYTISVVINDSPNTSAPIFCEALMLVSALIQVIPGSILEATYFRIGSKAMILFYENNSQLMDNQLTFLIKSWMTEKHYRWTITRYLQRLLIQDSSIDRRSASICLLNDTKVVKDHVAGTIAETMSQFRILLAKQIVNEEKDNAKKRQMVYEDVDESSSSVPTTQKKIR